jgi:hypothetical protein
LCLTACSAPEISPFWICATIPTSWPSATAPSTLSRASPRCSLRHASSSHHATLAAASHRLCLHFLQPRLLPTGAFSIACHQLCRSAIESVSLTGRHTCTPCNDPSAVLLSRARRLSADFGTGCTYSGPCEVNVLDCNNRNNTYQAFPASGRSVSGTVVGQPTNTTSSCLYVGFARGQWCVLETSTCV